MTRVGPRTSFCVMAAAVLALAPRSEASPILLPPDAFAGSALIDFTGVPFGPVNGRTIDGVTFVFTVGGVASTDARIIDVGPGADLFPTLEGDSLGVLSLFFPEPQFRLGYLWAIDSLPSIGPFTNVHRLELFDASHTSLGALAFDFSLNVNGFIGGLVGAGNDVAFSEAVLTFPSTIPGAPGSRFAIDNLQFSPTATPIPEPATVLLIGTGLLGIIRYSRRR